MNIVWVVLFVVSSTVILITNPSEFLSCISSATANSVTLCISLCGIYAFWLGIMQIVSDCGLLKKFSNLLSPVITLLFGHINPVTKEVITLNIAANILRIATALQAE